MTKQLIIFFLAGSLAHSGDWQPNLKINFSTDLNPAYKMFQAKLSYQRSLLAACGGVASVATAFGVKHALVSKPKKSEPTEQQVEAKKNQLMMKICLKEIPSFSNSVKKVFYNMVLPSMVLGVVNTSWAQVKDWQILGLLSPLNCVFKKTFQATKFYTDQLSALANLLEYNQKLGLPYYLTNLKAHLLQIHMCCYQKQRKELLATSKAMLDSYNELVELSQEPKANPEAFKAIVHKIAKYLKFIRQSWSA